MIEKRGTCTCNSPKVKHFIADAIRENLIGTCIKYDTLGLAFAKMYLKNLFNLSMCESLSCLWTIVQDLLLA